MPTRPALVFVPFSVVVLLSAGTGCDQAASSDDGPGAGQAQQTLRNNSGQDGEKDNGGGVKVEVRLNHNPVIINMTVEASGSSAQHLGVQANDRDGDPLTFVWTADCAGQFDDIESAQPVFTPELPTPSSCTFHVVVSDDLGGSGSGDLSVSLQAPVIQVGSE